MKTYTDLYGHVHAFQNLYTAYRRARRGKRKRPDVAAFEFVMEANLLGLQAQLRQQTYRPGRYFNFVIHEPRQRLVSAAPFRSNNNIGFRCVGVAPEVFLRGQVRWVRGPPRLITPG